MSRRQDEVNWPAMSVIYHVDLGSGRLDYGPRHRLRVLATPFFAASRARPTARFSSHLSYGVAGFVCDAGTEDSIPQLADDFLYLGKQSGRSQVVVKSHCCARRTRRETQSRAYPTRLRPAFLAAYMASSARLIQPLMGSGGRYSDTPRLIVTCPTSGTSIRST